MIALWISYNYEKRETVVSLFFYFAVYCINKEVLINNREVWSYDEKDLLGG